MGVLRRPERRPELTPNATEGRAIHARLRGTFASGTTKALTWRKEQLAQLERLLVDEEEEFLAALHADLGKPSMEGWLSDLAITRTEIRELRKNLDRWTAPQDVKVNALSLPGKGAIIREPLGLALVIAPWNYPVQLVVVPLAGAIAAGCAVVVKPSELAPATSDALARLLPRYLDTSAIAVIEGGIPETTELLGLRWDTIFYTGNATVARAVARAAAEHLTPCTFELGGKSPVIVDRDAAVSAAASRIAWGKFLNAGQTCVAPDHVLVHESIADELTDKVGSAIRRMYGTDPSHSADYARIVNDRHFARLEGLIDSAGATGPAPTLAFGGRRDATTRYIEPTILRDVADDAPVMAEEIFGPVLPIIAVPDVDTAIERVNAGEKPLALYAFSKSDATLDRIVASTSSGGVARNHVVLHLAVPSLPFGGVGNSGMGAYHGQASIDAFSHRRSVLTKASRFDPPLLHPPFTTVKRVILRRATLWP